MLSNMDDLRVLIVAGDPLARAGLATLLADQPGFTVVGQGAGDADLPAEVAVYRPDVVVWDLGWDPAPTLETSLERLADLVTVRQYGHPGFIRGKPGRVDVESAARGLAECKAALVSGEYALVVLDEANVAVTLKLFGVEQLHELLDKQYHAIAKQRSQGDKREA